LNLNFALLQSSSDFEILGLNKTFLVNIFLTPSRIEGIGLTEIEKRSKEKISKAFPNSKVASLLSLEIEEFIGGEEQVRNICSILLLLLTASSSLK
jgi:hypothetical protein